MSLRFPRHSIVIEGFKALPPTVPPITRENRAKLRAASISATSPPILDINAEEASSNSSSNSSVNDSDSNTALLSPTNAARNAKALNATALQFRKQYSHSYSVARYSYPYSYSYSYSCFRTCIHTYTHLILILSYIYSYLFFYSFSYFYSCIILT